MSLYCIELWGNCRLFLCPHWLWHPSPAGRTRRCTNTLALMLQLVRALSVSRPTGGADDDREADPLVYFSRLTVTRPYSLHQRTYSHHWRSTSLWHGD